MKKGFPFFLVLLFIIVGLTGCGGEQPVFFNLEISIENGNGTVDPEPGTHRIQGNSVVTISVEPAQGYFFKGWGGSDGHRVNENKVLMDRDIEISVIFQPYQSVSSPEFSLEEGTYTGSQELEINSETEGAKIIFTVDGTDPSSENGEEYIQPIEVFKDTKIKAIATKEGLLDSEIVGKNYQINYLLEVEIEPKGGGDVFLSPDKEVYKFGEEVQLEAIESEGYEFSQWTEDVSDDSNPLLISVNKNKFIKANFSALDKVDEPIFSLEEGSYTGKQLVEITSSTEGAEIIYTLDGTIPGTNNGEFYTSEIEIYKDSLIKAIAVKEGMVNSEVVQVSYEINYSIQKSVHPSNAGTITLDPQKDFYKFGEEVEISVEGAEGYTFNNWTGDLSGDENPTEITIEDCLEIVANFDDKLYRVTFHVNDEDGNDLEGVEILIGSETILTDPQGEAKIYLTAGQHSYSAKLSSHELVEGTIDIEYEEFKKEITLKFVVANENDLIMAFEDQERTIINLTSNVYNLSNKVDPVEVSGEKVIRSDMLSKIYFHVDQEVNQIQPESNVSMRAKVPGDWEIGQNRVLILDTIVEGDFILSGGDFQLGANSLEILGDSLQKGGNLIVGNGLAYVGGDYLIEEEEGTHSTGQLKMLEPEGRIIVEGNFLMDSSQNHTGNLIAGEIELRGNFVQRNSRENIRASHNFAASEDHRVVLNGTAQQEVNFENPNNSHFAVLKLDNSAGVDFLTRVQVTEKIIDAAEVEPLRSYNLSPSGDTIFGSVEWAWDLGIHYDWNLQEDIWVKGNIKQSRVDLDLVKGDLMVDGNFYLEGRLVTLNENKLKIGGNLYHGGCPHQGGANLKVGEGELRVEGNYLIAKEEDYSPGNLIMHDPEGLVVVEGKFVMDSSQNHTENLKAGTIELRGNFVQRNSRESFQASHNFGANDDHRVVFNGSSQQEVSFKTPGNSHFAILKLDNPEGIKFLTRVPVTKKIIYTDEVELINGSNFSPVGMAEIKNGFWPWSLRVDQNWLLQHDLTIQSDLYLYSGTLEKNGYQLEVQGTIFENGGSIAP